MESSSLTPSQTIRTTSNNSNPSNNNSGTEAANVPAGNNPKGRQRQRQRRRNNHNKTNSASSDNGDTVKRQENNATTMVSAGEVAAVATAVATAAATDANPTEPGTSTTKNPKRRKNKNKNKKTNDDVNKEGTSTEPQEQQDKDKVEPTKKKNNKNKKNNNNSNKTDQTPNNNSTTNNKNGKNKNNNNKNRKRYPWRKYIPAGTMDPITLDDLATLPYPPFALRAAEPYLPVPEWPPLEKQQEQQPSPEELAKAQQLEALERERSLLQAQWGKAIVALEETKPSAASAAATADATNINNNNKKDHSHRVNLFDGRALAYYMVSQLQFIDPLTRRDLDREELCHLDRYLVRNGFTDLNVVEAYDTKGVSLSTAGAASRTAAGRAEILQQEARVLLTALFGGGPSVATATAPSSRQQQQRPNNSNAPTTSNALSQQYSNYQESQQRQAYPYDYNDNNHGNIYIEDTGVYGNESDGIMVIDDDMNPSLRGGGDLRRPYATTTSSGNNWNPRPNNQRTNLQADNFPALSSVSTLPPNQSPLNTNAPDFVPAGASLGSSRPSQNSTQQQASTKKKNLPPAKSLKIIAGAVKKTTPEEAQRQFEAREEARRKAMLSNLTFGANPASWDAATTSSSLGTMSAPAPTEGQLARNQAFAEALGIASAPDSNNAARILQGWARPTNAAVHTITQYPDPLILKARENMGQLLKLERKWKSFLEDDNAASLPLNPMAHDLRAFVHEYSDYWKLHTESFDPEPKRYIHCVKLLDTSAPYPLLSDAARRWRGPLGSLDYASQQAAGQDTWGREMELPRGPRPRDAPAEPALVSNPRAVALAPERPKLELKERTLPRELPPFVPPAAAAEVVEIESEEQIRRRQMRMEEQKRKEQERELRKQRVLEAAFASDDEEESLKQPGNNDDDSDWEEPEPLYHSDEE